MRALIVGPHPGSTTGFVTVAATVARQLVARGWSVTYLAIGARPRRPDPPDLDVVFVRHVDEIESWLLRAVAAEQGGAILHVLCSGYVWQSAGVARLIADHELSDRVEVTVYVAVDHAPVPAEAGELARSVDRLVPSTRFGRDTLAEWVPVDEPIPHGVDTAAFSRLDPDERQGLRRDRFGLDDDGFLIGTIGRNSGHKRIDLALRAVAHVVHGAAVRCGRCEHLTVDELDERGHLTSRATRCRSCGSRDLHPERPRPVSAYFHTDTADRRVWGQAGGADLLTLAERFSVTDVVRFADLDRPDEGLPLAELAALMGCLDVHLLLSEGAGWELTVLETAACGVPNVVTDHAALPEYARSFSELVPPAHFHLDHRGCRAIADLDHAVDALVRLHDDPVRRAQLGAAGPETAAGYSWDRVGELWHERLLGSSSVGAA